jgi:WD40 repeat protein
LKDSEGALITKVVLPGEIPRLLFTAEDQPLAISKQFIFDIAGQHRLAEKVLWNHEKQFREMMIEDLSTNQQRIVTRYGPSSTRWLVRIWDVPSGREIFVANEGLNRFDFSLNKRHALSPDGRWLAVCDRNKIKFWKIFDPMVE